MVAGNHRPSIQNVDEALRRRVHLVPFTVTIPAAERDPALGDKLMAEADGILAWAVDGCLEWQRHGLSAPASVRKATDDYFEAEDAIGRWIAECCELDPQHREPLGSLYGFWRRWGEENGEPVGSTKNFSVGLSSRGFRPYRDRSARGFLGLRLADPGSDGDRL